MRTLHSFATICVFGAALAGLTAACSSDGSSGGSAGAPGAAGATSSAGAPGTAGAGTAGASTAGDATKGAQVYKDMVCGSCHGDDAKGLTGPNITASVTAGIGSWTYQQFHDAVRLGKGENGRTLCVFMSQYLDTDISEAGMQDLYAYLRSLPVSDVPNKGTSCPN